MNGKHRDLAHIPDLHTGEVYDHKVHGNKRIQHYHPTNKLVSFQALAHHLSTLRSADCKGDENFSLA
jgi:hypothetical protein